jgi:chemosensory pili system protein ChpA (sensor histidine kinase/response regulator)
MPRGQALRVVCYAVNGTGVGHITRLLPMAITRALLVRSAGRTYAVPLYFADRILDGDDAAVVEAGTTRCVKVDGGFMRLEHLEHLLVNGARGDRSPVLVLRVGEQRMAVQVDAVVGPEEVVVKSLGDLLAGHPLFAGVTMRGTGDLVLIMDVPGLMRRRTTARAPLATDDTAGAARLAPAELEGGERPELAGATDGPLRVLFVDDSLSVRKVAEQILEGLGHHITVAIDGVDGLAKLREGSFDLVFTDLEMPRMHGFDFIREVRFFRTNSWVWRRLGPTCSLRCAAFYPLAMTFE